MTTFFRRLAPLCAALVLAAYMIVAPTASTAQTDQRCFPETGQCVAGAIRAYWERSGGLAVFGFPIAAQGEERIEGKALQVQWFERDRLEIQPGGTVTTGRLGVERLEQLGAPWQRGPGGSAGAGCLSFAETGYQVCGAFAQFWQRGGGLARYGLPVTGELQAQLEGQTYTVQYFERRRFELHPEAGPNTVLLGLLGREVYAARQAQPQPTPAAPPALPAPSYNNCQADPTQAPDYPVKIVGIDDRAEVVRLQNVSPQPVSLDGWIMCSVKGNQRHEGIGGTLAPGEVRDFPHPGSGTIWNNSEPDPGALYNAQGQLVSYWAE